MEKSSIFGNSSESTKVKQIVLIGEKIKFPEIPNVKVLDFTEKDLGEVSELLTSLDSKIDGLVYSANLFYQEYLTSIISKETIEKYFNKKPFIISIVPTDNQHHPLFQTTRTPDGELWGIVNKKIEFKGKDNVSWSNEAPYSASIFYYNIANIVTPDYIIQNSIKLAVNHFINSPVEEPRNLSLMASTFNIVELFGDGDMGVYMQYNKDGNHIIHV